MENFFNSIFSGTLQVGPFFLMVGVSLAVGILYSYLVSFKVKSSPRFYIITAILPTIIAMIIALVNGNIGTGIAIAGAFSLIRFRSAQGSSEEIGTIFITMASGLAFGMGYLAYGAIFMIVMGLVYVGLTYLPIFSHQKANQERMLQITIPEDLNYHDVFEDILNHYTSFHELLKAKTTNMGSMYKLSYKIKLKNPKEEKEMIDELRVKNGNLDIAVETYETYRVANNSL